MEQDPMQELYESAIALMTTGDLKLRGMKYEEAKQDYIAASDIFLNLAKNSDSAVTVTLAKRKIQDLITKVRVECEGS